MTNVDDDFQNMINSYEEEKAKAESKKSEQKPPQSDKIVKVKFEAENFALNQYGKPKVNSLKNIRIAIENDNILKNQFYTSKIVLRKRQYLPHKGVLGIKM